jgi:hypothetical protein
MDLKSIGEQLAARKNALMSEMKAAAETRPAPGTLFQETGHWRGGTEVVASVLLACSIELLES